MTNKCKNLIQNGKQCNIYATSNEEFKMYKKKEDGMTDQMIDNFEKFEEKINEFENEDKDKENEEINRFENKDNDKLKKINCIGFKSGEDKVPCPFFGRNGKRTCINHRDMENYTDEMMKNIKKCTSCYGKPRWRYMGEKEGCNMCANKFKMLRKCGENGGLMANGEKCIKRVKDGTNYCVDHKDLISYTPQMLADQKYCSTGNHIRYCGGFSTCEKCRNIAKAKRIEVKNIKEQREKCLYCDSKVTETNNSKYCKKHERLENLNAIAEKENKKTCANIIRGCKNLLELDYKYKKCRMCLDKSNSSKRLKEQKTV